MRHLVSVCFAASRQFVVAFRGGGKFIGIVAYFGNGLFNFFDVGFLGVIGYGGHLTITENKQKAEIMIRFFIL